MGNSTANVKAVITAEDRASQTLDKFGIKTVAIGNLIANAISSASSKVAELVKNTATFGIKSAADFEQTRIGLENMLGSADKARSLLSDISRFAAETPFEFPELAQATRQLVAFGFSGEDAFNTMKQLGDVSAAIGAPINDLAYLMGTLKTQGRAFTIDIRQFAQRGIPIYEYLAKVLKTNEQEISKMIEAGKIGFPEVQKAFQAMTAQGGKFNGTMAKQSKSLAGLFSTLKDNLGQTLRTMIGISNEGDIVKGSLFDMLTTGITAILPKLDAFAKAVGPVIQNAIKETAMAIKLLVLSFQENDVTSDGFHGTMEKIGSSARKVWDILVKTLGPSLKALGATLAKDLGPSLKKLLPYLDDIAKIIGGLIVAALWIVINAINVFSKALAFNINVFMAVKDAAVNTVSAVINSVIWMKNTIVAVWQGIYDGAMAVWQAIYNNIIKRYIDFSVAYLKVIGVAVEYVWGWVNALTMVAWNFLYNNVVSPVLNKISQGINWLGGVIGNIWDWISAKAAQAWGLVSGFADNSYNWVVGRWQSIVGWFSNIWNGISNAAVGPGNAIKSTFSNIMESVKSMVKDSVNWIIHQVNNVVDGVNKAANKVPGAPKMSTIPYLASGTRNFGGGMAIVGERGPELVSLPRGSNVYSSNESKQMMNQAPINITIQAGAFMGTQMDARKFALYIQQALEDAQTAKGMSY